MRRSTRKSSAPALAPSDLRDSVGNFSTRFSSPSFTKRVERLTDGQRSAIQDAAFGNLLLIPNHTLSKNLLVELMDRWSGEKQAFSLPHGDLKITLLDVALILGLPVTGKSVLLREDEPLSDLEIDYGASPGKRKISAASLESRLDALGGEASDDFTRTFLLFTFGTYLFPNANGKVDARFLHYLTDVGEIHSYAWGAAVLEDTLTWLNRRKEETIQYVGGCLLLLQIWCYEHLDMARPNQFLANSAFPRASRWENSKPPPRSWFTSKFQDLTDDQISWELQLTAGEKDLAIVKEYLQTEDGKHYSHAFSITQDSSSVVSTSKVELDVDSIRITRGQEEVDDKQPGSSGSILTLSEEGDEHMLLLPTLDQSPTIFVRGSENDLIQNNKLLEDKVSEQRKEIDDLKTENSLLKAQNMDLKRQVDELRRKCQNMRLSSNLFMGRVDKLLLDGCSSDL
ncbi:hypothetical protein MLD38_032602 [Melastoma candidum]|uniref:Uncharacterized protein n=1 Tax=Melastoma candidum TaxID=119954 RepID=A0ACB9M6C8_9MYRT|nr:hypothetical protein MLD38_032602 [Melastoma candidum]